MAAAKVEPEALEETEETDEPEALEETDEPEALEPVEAPEGFGGLDEDALQRESRRHTREMQRILGPLFPDAVPCSYCDGSGVTPEALELPPEMKADPTTERCETCGGLGLMRTGSLRDGQRERSCTSCMGNGYITRSVQLPPPTPIPAPSAPQPFAGVGALPPGIPAGTLDVLRSLGYTVFEPPAPAAPPYS